MGELGNISFYDDKIAHLDKFMNWLGVEGEKKMLVDIRAKVIRCTECDCTMDVQHQCYGHYIKEVHGINGKVVCHVCWDRWLEYGIKICGY